MKNSKQRATEALPRDVHDALSYLLKAYSIFTPNPQLPLFQAVLVNPDRAQRHKSPQVTPLNLEAIVYEATNIPHMEPPPDCQHLIDLLRKEISERVEPPREKPMCSDLEDVEPEIAVSVSSLLRAEVTGIVPEVNATFGGRFSKEKRRTAKLKLTSQKSRRYSGSYLGLFMWEQGEFLFKRMLFYLHGDLGIKVGDRRLLAFVTKHIYGTVSVSTTEFRDTNLGLAGPAPIAACFRSVEESEANCTNMRGVIGIHFIAFPVERVGDHKWRFFRPIEVVDEENTGSDSSIRFQLASKWASRETDIHLYNDSDNKDVCNEEKERIENELLSNFFTTDPSTTSQRDSSAEDTLQSRTFQDISLSENHHDWVDVELGEQVQELARRQVAVARHYMSLKGNGNREYSELASHLIRRAAAIGNRKADDENVYKHEHISPSILKGLWALNDAGEELSIAQSSEFEDGRLAQQWTTEKANLEVFRRFARQPQSEESEKGLWTVPYAVMERLPSSLQGPELKVEEKAANELSLCHFGLLVIRKAPKWIAEVLTNVCLGSLFLIPLGHLPGDWFADVLILDVFLFLLALSSVPGVTCRFHGVKALKWVSEVLMRKCLGSLFLILLSDIFLGSWSAHVLILEFFLFLLALSSVLGVTFRFRGALLNMNIFQKFGNLPIFVMLACIVRIHYALHHESIEIPNINIDLHTYAGCCAHPVGELFRTPNGDYVQLYCPPCIEGI